MKHPILSTAAQTIITPAGMARLAAMAERRGKLTVVGGVA